MDKAVLISGLCLALLGCSKNYSVRVSSTATFDARKNTSVTISVVPDGSIDKKILVKGIPTEAFVINVGGSYDNGNGKRGSSSADIHFEVKNGRLQPVRDWEMAGGGERPALRRESEKEITIYYPLGAHYEGDGAERTWVRFRLIMQN